MIGKVIFNTFVENEFLSEDEVHDIKEEIQKKYKGNEDYYLIILRAYKQYESVVSFLLDKKVFTEDDIEKLENKIVVENIPEIKIVREIPEVKQIEEKIEEIKKSKVLSKLDIESLIRENKNLFEEIEGYQIPKDDTIFYAEVQLYRFIDSSASDFKLETQKLDGKICSMIRFKIDGEHKIQDVTGLYHPANNSYENENPFFDSVRKYIGSNLGKMNSDMKHIMLDSGFSLEYKNKASDFRLNSLPTRCGNNVYPKYAIRLTSDGNAMDFDAIEMLPFARRLLGKVINKRMPGCVLVTGPTGSGKTTTIYALLNKVDKIKYDVLSIEKPIESQVFGINQTQEDIEVKDNAKNIYNLFHGLKGCLRQGLDIIFLGELRTTLEVQEGVKGGVIGNQVIATIHTNSAVDTYMRLREEGLSNNIMANGVKITIAVRLVNRLCSHCSTVLPNQKNHIDDIRRDLERGQRHFKKELGGLLSDLPLNDLQDINALIIFLDEKFISLSRDDFKLCKKIILEHAEEIKKIKIKEKSITYILELLSEFPYPDDRKYIESEIKNGKFRKANPNGCKECNYNGYKGRIVVFEILETDKSIRKYIQDETTQLGNMGEFILDRGFINLKMYGSILALQGKTTLDKIEELAE